jgi:hypothetical protein
MKADEGVSLEQNKDPINAVKDLFFFLSWRVNGQIASITFSSIYMSHHHTIHFINILIY